VITSPNSNKKPPITCRTVNLEKLTLGY